MKQINVITERGSYPIVIASDFSLFSEYASQQQNKCVIITDKNVSKHHLDAFTLSIKDCFNEVFVYVITPGDESKSLKVMEEICVFLLKHNICRKDTIITLGGGVTGDLGGFVAASYLRGIKFIQVPTSLIAQVDSSVGGKTAVNLNNTKNIIGAFYQPELVYINYSVLKTLPVEEIRSGLVEIIVHAIIKDEKLFDFVEQNLERIMALDHDVLEELIWWNCRIKSDIVQRDENDRGERALLNFGHTYGHAIEGCYEYRYRHGECVAAGIIGACHIAERKELITKDITDRIFRLLERINVLPDISNCDQDAVMELMMRDKKFLEGKIFFILPLRIGKAERFQLDDISMIKEVLAEIVNDYN